MDELVQKYETTADDARDKYKALCNILKRVFQLEGLPWSGEQPDDKCCKRHYVMYYVQRMFDVPPTHLERYDNLVRLRVMFLFGQMPVMLSCNAKIECLLGFLDAQTWWLADRIRIVVNGMPRREEDAAMMDDVMSALTSLGRMYQRDIYAMFRQGLRLELSRRIHESRQEPAGFGLRTAPDQRRAFGFVLMAIFGELTDD